MSVTCGFYNSLNHDRKYDATQMSSIFDGIIRDGIFMSIGTHLSVTAGEGMFVTVGEGKAWFNHTWTLNDAELPLAIDVAELVLDRIDAVVLEVDSSESVRNNTIKVIKGTPSSEPERPVMEDTETLHQYPLAYIYVKANATQITTSDITNMIGTENTPFITGILETINIDGLIAQWKSQWNDQIDANQREYDAWLLVQQTSFLTWREDEESTFEAWRIENQAEFEEWFQNLQNQLDENQATNLQNQINDIKEDLKVTGGSRVVVTIDDKKGTIKVVGLTVTLRIDGAEYTSVVEENKTATFAGILEIGVAEIECNDSTQEFTTGCTLEIPCYSYYEATTVKVDMYEQWLLTAGYTLDDYPEVSDIVNDYEAMYRMMNLHATVDYWVRWYNANNTILSHFTTSEVAMKAIGENDYATDALMAIPAVKEALLGSEYWEYILNAKVPAMTGYTTPEGKITASGSYQGEFDAWRAFDGDEYSSYASENTSTDGGKWFAYQFVIPTCVSRITGKSRIIEAVTNRNGKYLLSGSNDNVTYDEIGEFIYDNDSLSIDAEFINDKYYIYYKVTTITDNKIQEGKYYSQFTTLQFYGRKLHALVPPMTSNTTPNGEVSANGFITSSLNNVIINQPYGIFAGVSDTSASRTYLNLDENVPDRHIQYKFEEPEVVNVVYLENNFDGSEYYITSFKVQASEDGETFKDISPIIEHSGGNNFGKYYSFENTAPYIAYRVIPLTHVNKHPTTSRRNEMNMGARLQFYGPSYEETVGLAVPGGFKDWLEAGGLNPDSYADMDELLEDEAAVRTLMTKKDAVDVLAKMSDDELTTIINHRYAAKWINYREYAYSTLSAKSEIKALMDASGMYGMYITAESKIKPLVPVLTSDNGSDGGEAFSDSVYDGRLPAWHAFDNDDATYFASTNSSFPHYLGYNFKIPTIVNRVAFTPDHDNQMVRIKEYIIQGSNGGEWTNIYTSSISNEMKLHDISFENNIAYTQYRIYAINTYSTSTNIFGLTTLQFYGRQLEALIPTMTSNTSDVGNCIGDISISSNPMYYAFDNNVNTECYRESVGPNGRLGYCFNSTKKVLCAKILNTYRYTAKLQYSDDGISWNDASSSVVSIENADVYIVSTETNEHEYWSIEYSNNEDSQFYTKEIQFYGEPTLWQPKGLVPVMTSNTAPYGEAFASSVYNTGYEAYRAFDFNGTHNYTVMWHSTSGLPAYLGYKFVNPTKVNKLSLTMHSGGGHLPTVFTLQGSNDNSEWIDIQSYNINLSASSTTYHEVNNDNYYMYYRLYITGSTSGTHVSITELQFYGRQLEALIPPMTSNTTPIGEASASSYNTESNLLPYRAFDGNDSTHYQTEYQEPIENYYLKYEFPKEQSASVLLIKAQSNNNDYYNVMLQGSNDNNQWDNLTNKIYITGEAITSYYVTLNGSKSYKYYRLICTDSKNPYMCYRGAYGLTLYTFQLYGTPDYESRTYIYDHGVEVMELDSHTSSTDHSIVFANDSVVINKGNSNGKAIVYSSDKINLNNYKLIASVTGDKLVVSTLWYNIGTANNIPSLEGSTDYTYVAYTIISSERSVIDVNNINQELHVSFGFATSGTGVAEASISEWWLE